ncbi:MAG TPA: tetratricopeptide repeat protein [Chitinophagaceae bacterium]|nr:tetratricopeptide repeat protein [Chitinophagaceae bacterium]
MGRPQWITIVAGIVLVTVIFLFARRIPNKTNGPAPESQITHSVITIDTILTLAKKQLSPEQVVRLNTLENSISRGDVKAQQLNVYHLLSHFWADSAGIFEPYAWYEAEAARLENSEKTLTFAARLFLENLEADDVIERKKWKALQAKDLFERSLKINPANDSSKVGLGACYLFGGISSSPMEGILKIKEVADRDSTNVYALMTLARGSLISEQYDNAIRRLESVHRHDPNNVDAIMMLAETYERLGDNTNAIRWYNLSLEHIQNTEAKKAVAHRIEDLKKK